jgi:ribonuclease BN (tRNA processing enzyme)
VAALLTVLGAGSILPRAGYGPAGYALESEPGGGVTLLDCGPGSVRALGAAAIALARVERVVLSHYHPDHCLDLAALFFARRNPALESVGGLGPLEVVGPSGLAKVVAGWRAAFGAWVEDPTANLVELPLERPIAHRVPGARWTAVPTAHTPHALAWRADLASGESLAYSGDSGENPAVADLARGADLFVAECSFPDEAAVEHHLTPSSAARLAARAGCQRLVLSHFYPACDPEAARAVAAGIFGGPIELARDGSRHWLRGGTAGVGA